MWRTMVSLGLAGAWLLAVSGAAAQAAPADCGEPVVAPTYNVGETWTWRDDKGREWSNEVLRIEGGMTQIKLPNGSIAYVDKDWVMRQVQTPDGKLITTQGAGTYTQIGQKDLDFPAQVGKQWMFTYPSPPSAGTGTMVTYVLRYSVVACEEVALPAGTFPALKVKVDQSIMGQSGSGTFFLWYAPRAKQWVKKQFVPSSWFSGTRFRDYELIRCGVK